MTDAAAATGAPPVRRWLEVAALAVAGIGLLTGLAVLLPGLGLDAKNIVNTFAYPLASAGSGVMLVAAAFSSRGWRRRAWLLLGLGVLCWGVGEIGSEFYWAAGREVPYPGWVDIFYLAGYPLLGAGVVLLPRLRLGRYERTRSFLDASIGAVALSVVAWLTYLDKVWPFDTQASLLETWVGALYPVGDVVLLLAVMALAFRRTERGFALELLAIGAALVVNLAADMVYFGLADAYTDGMWVDGLWLLGYAAFAAAAWLMLRSPQPGATGPAPYQRRLLVAYAPVTALLVIVLVSESSGRLLLTLAGATLTFLLVARQWVATREIKEITDRQRDAMLASVSHELRTPLTAVQGYAQLLCEGWQLYPDDERDEMVSAIGDQATHLGRIVTDIIDLTRGRTSAVCLDRQPQAVERVLQKAVQALPLDTQERITVEAGRHLVVDADAHRVHQVLVNLLTNAVRYGRSRILLTADRAGQCVLFRVHDDGLGVPKRFETAIWQRFERGAHRRDPAISGLGLGLPIARAMVEAHGGSIGQRRSERLGGACFEFTIPALPAAPEPASDRRCLLEATLAG